MKHRMTPTSLVIVFVGLLALGIMPELQAGEDQGCSNASLRGSYGFTGAGTILGVGAVASVGSFTSDGRGNLAGTDTISFNGAIVRESFTSTYTVNADCTGSSTALVQGPVPRTVHVDFIIVDHGNEVFNVLTDPGNVVTFVSKKIFPGRGKQD